MKVYGEPLGLRVIFYPKNTVPLMCYNLIVRVNGRLTGDVEQRDETTFWTRAPLRCSNKR